MCPRLVALILAATSSAVASAPQGVPRDLARERAAQVSDVHYELEFILTSHSPTTAGHERMTFRLHGAGPLLLDSRDGAVSSLELNGTPIAVKQENGHLELPAERLRAGENIVLAEFTANVAPAGKAITRYDDRDDKAEYLYTLFVPMDASMAFPCFDQPDLKARFKLELTTPSDWTVISNAAIESAAPTEADQKRTAFSETLPLSTYQFAFAAGPFRRLSGAAGLPGLYVRESMLQRAAVEAPEVQQIAAQGIAYLTDYFAQPFPYAKYDMVLIPGFPYGGMEHAGATFLREESVLFRRAPTHTDQLGRDILVLHELTHQWFGDLVTMRWFDDLWLKEGFAQYMAYQTLASLKPDEDIWKRFYESIKPAAYAIDSTQGTTPIYQDIPNLKDAKSAYGAIVYSKAPGVLKQLGFVLGPENFRNGLRLYLSEHRYANAEWGDLVRAFEQVSGRRLDTWANMWVRHRGMPQVGVAWSCSDNRLEHLSLSQHDVLGTNNLWPVATEVSLSYANAEAIRMRVDLNQRTTDVAEAAGKPCPDFVFGNDQDYAYGRFLLDARSRDTVLRELGTIRDLFSRTLLWGSLWELVRQAELAPQTYIGLATKLLPEENDESLTEGILSHTTTALHRYVTDETRQRLMPGLETIAGSRMMNSNDADLRVIWFRSLRNLAETAEGLGKLKDVLDGKVVVPGLELRELDRWGLVMALIAMQDPQADAIFDRERRNDHAGDALKYAYAAEAARPQAKSKEWYFDDYLRNASRPEDWIAESLGEFNYWNQSALTAPFLRPALEALPEIKRDRKIFFLVGWLDAFLDGQQSASAQAEVHQYLRKMALDEDLRLKILQAVDELDRTVMIRRKFPQ
jgi:aminopeptidase N